MKQGKYICNTLKAIRSEIASANEIDYTATPCDHEGDCAGTCPACESEMRWIERQLRARQALGKVVSIAGVSMALTVAASAATTAPLEPGNKKTKSRHRTSKTIKVSQQGNVVASEPVPAIRDSSQMLIRGKVPRPPEKHENDSVSNTRNNRQQLENKRDTIINENGDTVYIESFTTGIVSMYNPHPDSVFTNVDEEAQFPGGDEAMDSLIRDQLYIPEEILEPIKEMGGTIKARCIVKALVELDGTISDAMIEKTTTAPVFDEEALRVVKNLPPFRPARISRSFVRSWKLIPVEFIYDFSKRESEIGD